MSKRYNLYLGKSGQFAIMAEFLARGWNTCTPDVDVGDDVLVLEDRAGQFKRVQVKTASAVERNNGYSAQFNIPLEQLGLPISPEIHYVFMVRYKNKWVNTLIIKRDYLDRLYNSKPYAEPKKNWVLYISFQDNEVKCLDIDFSEFVDDFSEFPDISH
jgi:hypothetical protein